MKMPLGKAAQTIWLTQHASSSLAMQTTHGTRKGNYSIRSSYDLQFSGLAIPPVLWEAARHSSWNCWAIVETLGHTHDKETETTVYPDTALQGQQSNSVSTTFELQVITGIFFDFLTHQLNCFRRDSCNVNHAYRGKPNTHSLITPYLPRENVAEMGDFFPLFLKGEGGGGGACYFAGCNIKKKQ